MSEETINNTFAELIDPLRRSYEGSVDSRKVFDETALLLDQIRAQLDQNGRERLAALLDCYHSARGQLAQLDAEDYAAWVEPVEAKTLLEVVGAMETFVRQFEDDKEAECPQVEIAGTVFRLEKPEVPEAGQAQERDGGEAHNVITSADLLDRLRDTILEERNGYLTAITILAHTGRNQESINDLDEVIAESKDLPHFHAALKKARRIFTSQSNDDDDEDDDGVSSN